MKRSPRGVAMWVRHGDGRGGIITVLKQDTRDTCGDPSFPWWGHGSVQSGFLSGLRLSEAFVPSRGRGLPARGLRPPSRPCEEPGVAEVATGAWKEVQCLLNPCRFACVAVGPQ